MKKTAQILSLLLCVIMIISSCAVPAFAEITTGETKNNSAGAGETKAAEADPKVIVCANKGNWSNLPENSVQAVISSPCDYVSVDIKITKDGIPVLMEDETVERTCVDEKGKTAKGSVGDYTLEKIQKLYLRNKNGGSHNDKTENKVPSLSEVLAEANGKVLVLDFKLSDLDAVYEVVAASGAVSQVIFRIDGKADEIVSALSNKESVPETVIKYDGNIIFGVNKTIKTAKNSGLHMVQIGSKNQYGVIFYDSVKNKIKENGLTAVFSMTDGYSAKRNDNVSGWDDIISHGYKFIETDYPELLCTYVAESETLRQLLKNMTELENEYKEGTYPKNLMEEYNNAFSEAKSVAKSTASQSQLAQAYTRLNNACRALDVAEGTSTPQSVLNFTVGRIIAAVLCLAAVVAAQVFFYKRRKAK